MNSQTTSRLKSTVDDGWANLQRSRYFVKVKAPFFYVTVLGLIPTHIPRLGTMFVTNRMALGIDLEWFGSLTTEVGGGCLAHEVMHILRDHLPRMAKFPNQDLAGKAFDIPINDDLRKMGFQLPPWVIYSDTYKLPPGLTGEAYYELLSKMTLPETVFSVGSGNCGSCSGLPINTTAGGQEEGHGLPCHTPGEVKYFIQQGRHAIRQHAKEGGFGRGDMPSFVREFLEFDGTEEAIIPWQNVVPTVLSHSVGRARAGHSDYSLRRPAKRSYTLGLIRPGLISYAPTIAFFEDSSGSMGSPQLRENRVEFVSAMQQLGVEEVWFINCDAKVQFVPRLIRTRDLLELPVVGRGGTDFRPGINAAMSLLPRPDIIVCSTDGDGTCPEKKPFGVEFIWLLAPGPWTRSPCNWGIQILTTNDQAERKRYKILSKE